MENILFLRLRLLGDIIFTIPSIQEFHKKYPECKIYYVVEESFREIAELIPGIHQLIVIPRKMGLKQILQFRKKMRRFKFESAVDFHSGPKSALLTFVSGAKNRIGYQTPNRNWAFTKLIPRNIGAPPPTLRI